MSCSCCAGSCSQETSEPFIYPSRLAQKCPLDNGPKAFKYPMVEANAEKCQLRSLPIELVHACLQHLDIATLTLMRQVSQFIRSAIDSLHQYQEIYQHAPQALRACLLTKVAPHTPLQQLHHELTSMECYYCKSGDISSPSFGAYLSLYQRRRTCLFCLRNNALLKPVELATLISLLAKRPYDFGSLSDLDRVFTIPGIYGPHFIVNTSRNTLVRGASVCPTITLSDKEQRILFGAENTGYAGRIYHHPFMNPTEESGLAILDGYVSSETPLKAAQWFMSAIPFPYLPSSKTVVDYGVLCEECYLHMLFSEHSLREHQILRRRRTAGSRTRERINGVRREACRQYFEGGDAVKDALEMDGGRMKELSLREHREIHKGKKISNAEEVFRKKMRTASAGFLPRGMRMS